MARIVERGDGNAFYLEELIRASAGEAKEDLPESVLATFPESKRLTIHRLPRGENRSETVLIWRKGAGSPNIQALKQVLSDGRAASRRER